MEDRQIVRLECHVALDMYSFQHLDYQSAQHDNPDRERRVNSPMGALSMNILSQRERRKTVLWAMPPSDPPGP